VITEAPPELVDDTLLHPGHLPELALERPVMEDVATSGLAPDRR